MLATRNKERRVVAVQDGVVRTRYVRRDGRWRYDRHLQEVLDLEGPAVLKSTALRWFHGYVTTSKRR